MSRLPLLIDEFALRNGIEALRPDRDGRYHIVVDEFVHVRCFERFGQLYLVSPLGPVPEPGEGGRRWLKRLLNHALKRMKHGRGTPALDDDGNAVFFVRHEIANLSIADLETRIAEHVNVLESYRRQLDAQRPPLSTAAISRSVLRP